MDRHQGGTGRSVVLCAVLVLATVRAAHGAAAGDEVDPRGPAPLVVDGVFDDWTGVATAATDPVGDATGAFDVSRVFLASRGTRLVIRFDTGTEVNLQSGATEDGTLLLRVRAGGGREAVIDVRSRAYAARRGDEVTKGWTSLDYESAPTHSAREFEAALELAAIGVAAGDEVTVSIEGSDTLAAPIRFRLETPDTPPALRSHDRAPDTDLRIVSLNTRRTGLRDPERREALLRLLVGPLPDVITIQEEYRTSARDIETALNASIAGTRRWYVHKANDCVIAAPQPLVPVHAYDPSYAAALVPGGGGRSLLVLSIHPRCCGYVGSREDRRRIEQTRAMVRTITEVRRAVRGDAATGASGCLPVVVIGDWNLVGSPRPLELFREAGLADLRLEDLHGRRVVTWRDEHSGFAPGRLDLVAYAPGCLAPRHGFVVDTMRLPTETLAALELEPGDSRATDHLLLVADFALVP